MRSSLAVGTLLLVVAAGASSAAQAPPEAAPAPPAAVSPDAADDERDLLLKILQELRGMRSDIRNLQRTLRQAQQPARPRPTPVPLPKSIELGRGQAMGSSDAQVALVEFSEFQCPYCKRYHDQTFGKVKEGYVDLGKILYEFRDFPLDSIHPQARPAALAARCAGEQGAYWKMHEELFAAQSRLGPDLYAQLAKKLGLDTGRFEKCLTDPAQDKALSEDVAAVGELGVRGTPHFFLGRVEDGKLVSLRRLSGAQPFASFRAVLDALLVQAAPAEATAR